LRRKRSDGDGGKQLHTPPGAGFESNREWSRLVRETAHDELVAALAVQLEIDRRMHTGQVDRVISAGFRKNGMSRRAHGFAVKPCRNGDCG
jgi:hypothetical protein